MAYAANAIIELKLGYVVNGQQCYNMLHVHPVGDSTGLDPQIGVSQLIGHQAGLGNGLVVGEFKKIFGNNVTINRLTGQLVYPTRYAVLVEELSVVGDVASQCEAQNVQAAITKRGELGNRHNIGGLRIGGLPVSAYNDGLISAAHQTLLTTLKTNLLEVPLTDGATALDYDHVILNKQKVVIDGKDHYFINGSTNVWAWEVQDQLRTQRTRTVGKGI